MLPIDFAEANSKLHAPQGMEEEVMTLPIWRHPKGAPVISCWQLTMTERVRVLTVGVVWVHVWAHTHPPLALDANYPFERPKRDWSLVKAILKGLALTATGAFLVAFLFVFFKG